MQTSDSPLLEARNISKAFGGAHALKSAGLDVRPGEVHALLGANGAGKSTLIKVLNGIHRLDEGQIFWEGARVSIRNLADARALGIATMFQQLNVPSELTVAQYLTLGREVTSSSILRRGPTRTLAKESLDELGIELELDRLCGGLSVAEKELLEISRAVSQNARLVIMDEPTASLGIEEVAQLFSVIRRLRERGVGIVYVSHKLEEVLEITDRSTVLRDGSNAGTRDTADVDEAALLSMMVGSYARSEGVSTAVPVRGPEVIALRGVATESGLRDVSLALHQGEVLGIYGLMGAGRTELLRAIYGLDRITEGTVELNGSATGVKNPVHARSLGMGLVPEDRIREALIPDQSIVGNLAISSPQSTTRFGWFSKRKELALGLEAISDFGIKVHKPGASIMTLSGGNQQKVVLGRWFVAKSRILLLDDPTVGVDVPAKHDIYRLVRQLASQGVSVILCSSEVSEVLHVSDRILIMHRKRIVANLDRAEATAEELERLSIVGKQLTTASKEKI